MKQGVFLFLYLFIGAVAHTAGIPHLIPSPQQVTWNGLKFHAREIALSKDCYSGGTVMV